MPVDDDKGEKLLKLMELNEHDDVQNVYANFEVSDAVMAKLGGSLAFSAATPATQRLNCLTKICG